MATESLTAASIYNPHDGATVVAEFDKAPAYPVGLFQVNAGVERYHALSTAQIVSDFVRERMQGAVHSPIENNEAYILALLLDMVNALYRASGAEV